jgi:peptidyl-prolyl cis-trans isomerase B (cyclophilin B)
MQTVPPKSGEEVAIISTPHGDIMIRLFPEHAPKTVENFVTHAKNGYYDDVIFHRIIEDFMIQGGDPDGRGTGGESIWGKQFEDEFHPELQNIRGSLSMANAGPNTNGSQFFINQADNDFLDNKHSVFGHVFEGMDTVDAIAGLEKDIMDKPLEPVKMTVRIEVFE